MTKYEYVCVHPLTLTLRWESGKISLMGMAWHDGRACPEPESRAGRDLASSLARYLGGEPVVWPELPLAWESLTGFRAKVLRTLATEVGWGEAVTYGGLAAMTGNRRASRAVGRVMATNPWPLVVPCHRVLGSGGRLAGFGPGPEMKRLLLDLENIQYRQ